MGREFFALNRPKRRRAVTAAALCAIALTAAGLAESAPGEATPSVCLPGAVAQALVFSEGRLQSRAPGRIESIWDAEARSPGLLTCSDRLAVIAMSERSRTRLALFERSNGAWRLRREERLRGRVEQLALHDGRIVLEIARGGERELRLFDGNLERLEPSRRLASPSSCLAVSGSPALLFSGAGPRIRTFRLPELTTWLVFEFDEPVTACGYSESSGLLAVATGSSLEVVDPRSEAFRGRLAPLASNGDHLDPVEQLHVVGDERGLRTVLTATETAPDSLRVVDLGAAGAVFIAPSAVAVWKGPAEPLPSPAPATVADKIAAARADAPVPVESEPTMSPPAEAVPDRSASVDDMSEAPTRVTSSESPRSTRAEAAESPSSPAEAVPDRSASVDDMSEAPTRVTSSESPPSTRAEAAESPSPPAAEPPNVAPQTPPPSKWREPERERPPAEPPPARTSQSSEPAPEPYSVRIVLKGRVDLVAEVILLGPDSLFREHSRRLLRDVSGEVRIEKKKLPPGRYRVQPMGAGGRTLDVRPPFAAFEAGSTAGATVTFEIFGDVSR